MGNTFSLAKDHRALLVQVDDLRKILVEILTPVGELCRPDLLLAIQKKGHKIEEADLRAFIILDEGKTILPPGASGIWGLVSSSKSPLGPLPAKGISSQPSLGPDRGLTGRMKTSR